MSGQRGKERKFRKEIVLEAIKGSAAIVTTVAKRLGCQWVTAKSYIDKWEETRRALQDEAETVLDMAESKLFESIKGGNTQDGKWLLSRKAKDRGYADNLELAGENGGALKIQIVPVKNIDANTDQ